MYVDGTLTRLPGMYTCTESPISSSAKLLSADTSCMSFGPSVCASASFAGFSPHAREPNVVSSSNARNTGIMDERISHLA